ncbi:DUF1364 family protein [Burkholderia sp. USMB20]|nr:DUF1364 family protein [Burkholderia sp. USMB20]
MTFRPDPKPVRVVKPRKGLSPGSGFRRREGKVYRGFGSRARAACHAPRDVFVDEAGDAHYIGHQDPHGVYRDVNADDVRGGVRVFNPGNVDEHGEIIVDKPFKRERRINHGKKPRARESEHDARYLAACRRNQCYLRWPGCMANGVEGDTVVPAHENQGKGMGMKAPDERTIPACFSCHSRLDQGMQDTREQKRRRWDAGYRAWQPVRDHALGLMEHGGATV